MDQPNDDTPPPIRFEDGKAIMSVRGMLRAMSEKNHTRECKCFLCKFERGLLGPGPTKAEQANTPPPRTFTCAACNGTFDYAWTDEEAQAERDRAFPGLQDADSAQVCEDCYQQMRKRCSDLGATWECGS